MNGILGYYQDEAGSKLAVRFFDTFIATTKKAAANPRFFHPLEQEPSLRRAKVKGFPYHFLYRETATGIRILVLRHDNRHWMFGLKRK